MLRTLALSAAVFALATPAIAAWRVAESPHFRLHGRISEASLKQRAAVLEDYRALLVRMTDGTKLRDEAPPLDIYLVDELREMRPFSPPIANASGVYLTNSNRIAAFSEIGDGAQTILLHEYAHHFMLGSSRVAYPGWYVEGFAEYFSTATFRDDRIEFGHANANRAGWLLSQRWLPLDKILAPAGRRGEDETAMFYAQSWLMTHYLFRSPGMTPKFNAYLAAVARGEDSVAAFRTHVDADFNGFQSKLRRYLTGTKFTFTRVTRSGRTEASIAIKPLPASADAVMLPLVALDYYVPKDRRPAALASIRKAAERYPDDALAAQTLALAELRIGDSKRAAAALDALLAKSPKDATLLRLRAEAMEPETPAERVAARKLLVRAFTADPNDWRTLHAYTELADQSAKPDPATLDVILRAYELAPQVSNIGMTAAVALARNGQLAEAANVLEPFANSPHGGGFAERAGLLMAKARAGDQPGFMAALRGPVAAETEE